MKSQNLIIFLALSLFCGCATTNKKTVIRNGNQKITITEREASKQAAEQIARDLNYMKDATHGIIFQSTIKK